MRRARVGATGRLIWARAGWPWSPPVGAEPRLRGCVPRHAGAHWRVRISGGVGPFVTHGCRELQGEVLPRISKKKKCHIAPSPLIDSTQLGAVKRREVCLEALQGESLVIRLPCQAEPALSLRACRIVESLLGVCSSVLPRACVSVDAARGRGHVGQFVVAAPSLVKYWGRMATCSRVEPKRLAPDLAKFRPPRQTFGPSLPNPGQIQPNLGRLQSNWAEFGPGLPRCGPDLA